MRRTFVFVALVAVAAALALPALARADSFQLARAAYHNPRFFGMGGAFNAVSDDRNVFFTNPAGLARLQRGSVTFALLPASINTNTLDIWDFYRDNDDRFDNLENMTDEEQGAFYDDVLDAIGGKRSETSAHFPLAVLWPAPEGSRRPNFGLGFFARGGAQILVQNGAAGIPVATADVDVEYTGVLSAAYNWDRLLPGKLSAGASLKIDHRSLSLNHKSLLALSENEELDLLGATGMGIDVGALYTVTPSITVGLALFDLINSDLEFTGADNPDPQDILQEGDKGEIDPALSLGVAYRPAWRVGPLDRIVLACDVQEPFDGDQSFWKNVFAGGEARLRWLAPRLGFYQGYPGLGVGLGPLQYAYFSTEAGHFPGARSNYAHVASLEFAIGF